MKEMKIIMAQILRHFHLSVDNAVPVVEMFAIVLRAKHGINLFVNKEVVDRIELLIFFFLFGSQFWSTCGCDMVSNVRYTPKEIRSFLLTKETRLGVPSVAGRLLKVIET